MMQLSHLRYIVFYWFFATFFACAFPKGSFKSNPDQTVDYSNPDHWAALPTKVDSADSVPLAEWKDEQQTARADVFFIHPTTFTGKAEKHEWNASIDDEELNLKTDRSTIRYQASLFNGAGRVYAPRYRQSHLQCFYTNQVSEARQSLEMAYQDVKSAFQYYLEHYNEGRPFIIASHSQGTFHAKRLIRDVILNTEFEKQLIVAYLVGYHVTSNYFETFQPCHTANETGCFTSWRTVLNGYAPKKIAFPDSSIVVTNPVTWSDSIPTCGKEKHIGGILKDFETLYPHLITVSINGNLLWISKPKFPGSAFYLTKNYHIADYNLFYADVRRNAQERVSAYLSEK